MNSICKIGWYKDRNFIVSLDHGLYVSRKLPPYPSPKPTLTLTSHLGRGRWAAQKRLMIFFLCRVYQTRGYPGGTPGNSWWGCATRFSKSWPYSRLKNVIFHTLFQTWHHFLLTLHLLRLERQQKGFLIPITNSHITFSSLFIQHWNDKYFHTLP